MELRQDVRRLQRNIHGENGIYVGIIGTQKDIIRRLEVLEAYAEETKVTRKHRSEAEEKRRRLLYLVAPVVVGGAVTSLFGFLTNVLQTLAGVGAP
jgi:hypothetical protein